METQENNQQDIVLSSASRKKLERIVHELATELITYEPIISASAPRVLPPKKKSRKITHRQQQSQTN